MTLLTRFLACGLLVAPGLFLAQAPTHDARDTREKGDKLYADLGYKAALPYLSADATPSSAQMLQLATAYRLNHDTRGAELWYGQLVQTSEEPLYRLYYAQALQSNGRDDLAREHFDAYDAAVGAIDARGRAATATMRSGVRSEEVTVRNETSVNGAHLDFSPSFVDAEHVAFVSTRPVNRIGNDHKDKWMDDNFMSLFVAEVDAETRLLGAPVEFAPELNTPYHEGPLSFDLTGERVFFTRNTYNKGKRRDDKDGVMRLNIYTSARTPDGWQAATELPWNTDDYEEAHPSLSVDGRTLYFASNRPGGEGGMDLYLSRFENGRWGAPVNLGKRVNTAGNEAFPFIHADGTLYFASNGLGGLGGMDIFSVGTSRETGGPLSSSPANVGEPYNSSRDDFGYIVSADGTYGYFASARDDGAGGDDIYSFRVPRPAVRPRVQRICVFAVGDEDNRLANVAVRLEPIATPGAARATADGRDLTLRLVEDERAGEYRLAIKSGADPQGGGFAEVLEYTTDSAGYVDVAMLPGEGYRVVVAERGYAVAEEELWMVAHAGQAEDFCVGLSPKPAPPAAAASVVLAGVTKNTRYGNVLADVKLELVNLCTGETRATRSDAAGAFDFGCVPCGCEFVIKGDKTLFEGSERMVSSLDLDCAAVNCADAEPLDGTLSLAPLLGSAASGAGKTRRLVTGSVIELKNIYYDFDQSYIRPDARPDLDHVVDLLRTYTEMSIELGSHTDARGSDAYNKRLAQARATAAREYIIGEGISSGRVTAAGFGESRLRNGCGNGKDCPEAEHQRNRRTEIRITSMGKDEGVEVRYDWE